MKKSLSIIFLFLCHIASSQESLEWAPVGATWEYFIGGLTGNRTCSLTVEKDTFIQGKLCKKIPNRCYFGEPNIFLHKKGNDTIQYFRNNTFLDLYIFTVTENNQITLKTFLEDKFQPDPCNDEHIHTKVEQTSIIVGKTTIRKYQSKPALRCGMRIGSFIFDLIGPVDAYLVPVLRYLEAGYSITRYTDSCWDIEPIYKLIDPFKDLWDYNLKINRSCFTSSITNNDKSLDIKVYPNPTIDYTTIDADESSIKKISIYSITGQLLKISLGAHQKKMKIGLVDYPSGIYLLKVESDNKKVEIVKLIIK